MALSQYVAINFLTKFDKKGLERATKELKGFDKVVATGSFRLRAFAKAGGVAAAAGLALFTKRSIEAALAQERLDKQLQLSLRSLDEEFRFPEVKGFLDTLERATNVTGEELVPAFRKLVTQTGDLQSAQFLLSTALDTSAGTGADLNSVLDAINKAAIGNYKSIVSLGIGFTAAEAKAAGFTKIIQSLDKYQGAAEKQTETFSGQLKSFQISAGKATETLGEGFLIAGSYIAGAQGNLKDFGTTLENTARQTSDFMIGFTASFGTGSGLGGFLDAGNLFLDALTGDFQTYIKLEKEGIRLREQRTLQERGYLGLSQLTIDALEQQRLYGKKELTTEQILAKIQKDILAREKALTKEKRAQQELEKKKAELSAMFDIDRINLQAALSRKLSAEDELRVKILQKLADGTKKAVDEAERYADVLKVIEDGQITTGEVEMLAKKWGVTTTEVLIYLRTLFAANDELRKMLALLDEIGKKKMPVGMTFQYQQQQFQQITSPRFQESVLTGEAPNVLGQQVFEDLRKEGLNAAMAGSSARYTAQAVDYYQRLFDIPRMAEGGVVNQPTLALIGEAGSEAVIPLDKMGGMGTNVVVNVAGSVISEGELQSVIQDALYNLNRSGAVTQLTNLGR
jgi:hypothetical protein